MENKLKIMQPGEDRWDGLEGEKEAGKVESLYGDCQGKGKKKME